MNEQNFIKLCKLASIKPFSLDIKFLKEHWGQIKGGEAGIIKMRGKYKDWLKEWCRRGGKS